MNQPIKSLKEDPSIGTSQTPKPRSRRGLLLTTILALLGFDHTKLTFRFQGRDYRLTDVHGNVVNGLLA